MEGTQYAPSSVSGTNYGTRVGGDANQRLRAYVEQNITRGNSRHDIDRLVKLHLFWNFYKGKHWKDFNDTLIHFNYVKVLTNKVIKFLLGKTAFSFTVFDVDETIAVGGKPTLLEKIVNQNWRFNNKVSTAYKTLQMGSVSGDAFLALTYKKNTENIQGRDRVEISVIDSRYCTPEYVPGSLTELSAFSIITPLSVNDKEYTLFITKYSKGKMERWFEKTINDRNQVEEPTKYESESFVLPFDFIPVVQIHNVPVSENSHFSYSDIEDLLVVNKIYNEVNQQMLSIFKYHMEPTTVITGANARNLKKGLGNVWSGLPSDANVFNLSLDADMASAEQFVTRLKTSMHELSEVPENSLGQLQPISNTSAPALELTYQPIVHKADEKSITYGDGICEVNKKILQILLAYKSSTVTGITKEDTLDYKIKPVFSYGLPKDRSGILDFGIRKMEKGLSDRRAVLEELGENNIDELLSRVDEDDWISQKQPKDSEESNNTKETGNENQNEEQSEDI